MNRIKPSESVQTASRSLRNDLCRLETPQLKAKVSAHLRNCVVAEVIALVGMLDGHPKIKRPPTIRRGPAGFQQCTGTIDNPFCHAAPCNLLLNGADLSSFFSTANATYAIARIFGMGVMAPGNWAELNTFDAVPGEQNRSDNISERFGSSSGLVAAFEAAAANAAANGKWDGSGKRRHTRSSLEDFVRLHYYETWKPRAIEAYRGAVAYLLCRLAASIQFRNEARTIKLRTRIGIVEAQRDFLLNGDIDIPEVVNNIFVATAMDTWK